MPRYFLTRLEIEGFRGINNEGQALVLTFHRDAVNSIFAPNALGKSSIYEALLYAIRGSIPKLEALPASDHASDYYCNRFHSGRKATILLTLAPDDGADVITVKVERLPDGRRLVSSPSGQLEPEALLRSLDNDLALLDYKTFQKFIDDTPLVRGRSMASLVGLAKLSEFRQSLQILANARNIETDFGLSALQSQVTELEQKTREARQKAVSCYEKLIGSGPAEPLDPKDLAAKATDVLRQEFLTAQFFEKNDITSVDFSLIRAEIRKAEKGQERDRLATLVGQIEHIQAIAPAPAEDEQEQRLKRWIAARDRSLATTQGPLLHRLYAIALEVLRSEQWADPSHCPVCECRQESPLEPGIVVRDSRYHRVTRCAEGIRKCLESATWIGRLHALESLDLMDIKPEDRKYAKIRDTLFAEDVCNADVDAAVLALQRLESIRTTRLLALEGERRNLAAMIPASLVALTEKITYAEELNASLVSLHKALTESTKKKLAVAQIQAWKAFIEYAAAVFSAAEVALSTVKTTAIEKRYRHLYERITRNPQIVPVLRKASGSQDLYLHLENFYGQSNVAASPLLSESYRNALALSVYLATALEATAAARFIVLDDVTSSFDAGHQWFLMELIRDQVALPANINGPQIILLSHDGLLEKYFDTLSRYQAWHHQCLSGRPPDGHVLTQPQQADRLREHAAAHLLAGRISEAEPLIRQYLEHKLMLIIKHLAIPVPLDFAIRDDRRMVRNCLDAINGAVILHDSAGGLVLAPSQVSALRSVHLPAIIANWCSHYETATTLSVHPTVLLSIFDTIDTFTDCFRYDCKCGSAVRRRFYEDLTRKGCNC
ncbi:MAG: AAA family ATPase [Chloroflexi bacterium]|nr:AAA family ATPase [Chloroflexota bacterium]